MITQKEPNERWKDFANRLTVKEIGELSNKHIKAIDLMVTLEALQRIQAIK